MLAADRTIRRREKKQAKAGVRIMLVLRTACQHDQEDRLIVEQLHYLANLLVEREMVIRSGRFFGVVMRVRLGDFSESLINELEVVPILRCERRLNGLRFIYDY